MAVLGLDLGKKTLGIAKSDALGIAHPLEVYRFPYEGYQKAISRVVELVNELNIKEIALGLPLHLSGEESEMSKVVRIFKDKLIEVIPDIKIELVDERYSSTMSLRNLSTMGVNAKNAKSVVDMAAAQEILSTYLRKKGK